MTNLSGMTAFFMCILSLISQSKAHTWIEQLMLIASNGTMVGQPGFPRANVLRTSPGFKDGSMVFLIPPDGGPINKIDANQLMCKPEQTTKTQGANSPRLKAAPGQAVALRYQENGHVTLPANTPGKPERGGTNFVYFTSDSKPDDKFLQIHRQWTADGKGGDGRGRLISTQLYDDGQCYQVNGQTISKQRQAEFSHAADKFQGMDLWCQQDIQIPLDAVPGSTITLYWVWDWPTLAGTPGFPQGKQEIYTTCMDIDIVASLGQSKAVSNGYIKQDFANAAVSAQFVDVGNPTAVKAQLIPFSGVNVASSSSVAVVPVTSSSTSASVTVASSSRSTTTVANSQAVSPVTVTIRETVTATITPSHTRQASRLDGTFIATETRFITVVVTQVAAAGSNGGTTIQTASAASSQGSGASTLSSSPSSSPRASGAGGCSTSMQIYQLRARKPFYVVPIEDQPTTSSTAGSGC